MANAPLIKLGLLGELVLQSQGVSLRRSIGDSYSDYLDASEDPSLVGADCRDPAIGDHCFNAVKWSLEKGVRDHPEWYPEFHGAGLTDANFREMQLILHNEAKAGCGKPCPPFFTPYATFGSVSEPVDVEPPSRNIGEAQETEKGSKSPAEDEVKKEMDDINAPHGAIADMSLDSFNQFLNDAKWRDAMAASITTTVEETTSLVEEAVPENNSAAAAEEAQPNNTEATEAPATEREATVEEKINTLKAELEVLESMESSPPIDAMRQEKREQLQSLQATMPAEEAPAVIEPIEEGAPAPASDPAAAEPAAEACHTAVEGEDCYEEVVYSKQSGVLQHPERYDGLTTDSPFEAFQHHVHGVSNVCPVPCALGGDSSAEPASTDSQNSTDAAPTAGEQGPPSCHTAVEGDACYDEVVYSKQTGVVRHPDKYAGLTPDSPFEDFQRHVHSISSVCPEPCTSAASTDSQSGVEVTVAPSAPEQPKGIKGWFSRFRRGARETKKEVAAADEPAAEAQKFGALERVEQKLAPQSDAAEIEAEVNKKEAEMMAQEAQARVDQMEEQAEMKAQVARQQAKEEAEMEAARLDMMDEKAEALKASPTGINAVWRPDEAIHETV